MPWGFNTEASLPTQRHFTCMLRQIPNTFFQTLLDSTIKLIRAELAELGLFLGECIATDTITGSGSVTVTLAWTPPSNAVTTILRYAAAPITETNWMGAMLLTGSLPGDADTFTAANLPYAGGSLYFVLKSQNAEGAWSSLSNNAFWPGWEAYLPLLKRSSP